MSVFDARRPRLALAVLFWPWVRRPPARRAQTAPESLYCGRTPLNHRRAGGAYDPMPAHAGPPCEITFRGTPTSSCRRSRGPGACGPREYRYKPRTA